MTENRLCLQEQCPIENKFSFGGFLICMNHLLSDLYISLLLKKSKFAHQILLKVYRNGYTMSFSQDNPFCDNEAEVDGDDDDDDEMGLRLHLSDDEEEDNENDGDDESDAKEDEDGV